MRRTMPQIIMINHAAHVNKRRFDAKQGVKRGKGTQTPREIVHDHVGKSVLEMTTDEYTAYLAEGI